MYKLATRKYVQQYGGMNPHTDKMIEESEALAASLWAGAETAMRKSEEVRNLAQALDILREAEESPQGRPEADLN